MINATSYHSLTQLLTIVIITHAFLVVSLHIATVEKERKESVRGIRFKLSSKVKLCTVKPRNGKSA